MSYTNIRISVHYFAISSWKKKMQKLHSPRKSKTSQSPLSCWRPAATWHWYNPVRDTAYRWCSLIRTNQDRNQLSDFDRLSAPGSRLRACSFRSRFAQSAAQISFPRTFHERVMTSAKCRPTSCLRRGFLYREETLSQ